jgi:tetratricopeptide (TPR) repeat protein
MNCPYCNSQIPEDSSYCPNCNHPLLANIEKRLISPSQRAFSDQESSLSLTQDFEIPYDSNIIIDEEIENKLKEIDDDIQQKESYGQFVPGNLLLRKASLLYSKRDLSTAFKVLETALNSFKEEDDFLKVAIVNSEMALIQEELGFFDSSIYHNETAIEILRNLDDIPKLIQVYNNIANVYYVLKDLEHSYEFYDKALKLAEENNLILEEIKSSSNMVDILFLLKDYERIEKILTRNLSYFEKSKDAYGFIISEAKLGKLYYNLGEVEYDTSSAHLKKALKYIAIYSNKGEISPIIKSQLEWEILLFLGKISLSYGYDQDAEHYLLQSLESIRTFEVGESIKEGIILESIAELFEIKGEFTKAIEYYTLSNEIYYRFGDDIKTAEIKTKIGKIYVDILEDRTEAIKYFEEALEIFEEQNFNKESAEILHNLGDIYIQERMFKTAISNFERAKDYYQTINDLNSLNLINEKLKSLADSSEYNN